MASRNWDALSSDYRSRLERGGITRAQYESGASLSQARGHGKTPEHIGEGKSQERFREYYEARKEKTDHAIDLMRAKFGDRKLWNEDSARANLAGTEMASLNDLNDYADLEDYWEDYGDDADEDFGHYH